MENYDLMTLNTSRIGVDYLEKHKPDPSSSKEKPRSGIIGSFIDDAEAEIKNKTSAVVDDIEESINNAIRSVAKEIGIHDFYSVHVMNYCEGYFHPNGTSDRNVTHCSDTKGMSSFNATEVLQRQLNSGKNPINITLSDLHWPEVIDEGINDLKMAFNATFVLYCIAIIFIGLAFLSSIAGIFLHGRMSALVNMGTAGLGFLFIMIASAVVTYAATKITNLINKHGDVVNINAARGENFIALTWASTALVLVAGIAWFGDCIANRRKQKMIPKEYH
ncbi:MAG: hypothetical protein M1831_002098 [Alyxoria varia]|nr:MAG: hypothetical protein M1831_002098 [Alyxoria varia]